MLLRLEKTLHLARLNNKLSKVTFYLCFFIDLKYFYAFRNYYYYFYFY